MKTITDLILLVVRLSLPEQARFLKFMRLWGGFKFCGAGLNFAGREQTKNFNQCRTLLHNIPVWLYHLQFHCLVLVSTAVWTRHTLPLLHCHLVSHPPVTLWPCICGSCFPHIAFSVCCSCCVSMCKWGSIAFCCFLNWLFCWVCWMHCVHPLTSTIYCFPLCHFSLQHVLLLLYLIIVLHMSVVFLLHAWCLPLAVLWLLYQWFVVGIHQHILA